MLIRNSIETALAATGIVLNPVAASNNFGFMKAMVFKRVGIAFLTRAEILSEIRSGRLHLHSAVRQYAGTLFSILGNLGTSILRGHAPGKRHRQGYR